MCKILRSRLYIIVNRFKDRGENMEDNKLLRLLHKDPNAGMEQLMNQYTGLVYAVVKSKLDDSYKGTFSAFVKWCKLSTDTALSNKDIPKCTSK